MIAGHPQPTLSLSSIMRALLCTEKNTTRAILCCCTIVFVVMITAIVYTETLYMGCYEKQLKACNNNCTRDERLAADIYCSRCRIGSSYGESRVGC